MSNWGWVLSAAVAVSVLAGGCASTSGSAAEEKPRPEVMSGEGREEAKKLADEYVAGFVAALKENKFDKLKAVIPENSKTRVTPEMFEQMNKELTETMGRLVKAEYVTDLDKSIVRDYVWKFTFEKKSTGEAMKGKLLRNELFYMVRIGRLDGKYVIAGTGFRL